MSYYRKQHRGISEFKNLTTIWPSSLIPDIYLKENKSRVSKDICIPMFIYFSTIYNSQNMEPRSPEWMDR